MSPRRARNETSISTGSWSYAKLTFSNSTPSRIPVTARVPRSVCVSVGWSSTAKSRSAAASDCWAVVGICESCLSGGSRRITMIMNVISRAPSIDWLTERACCAPIQRMRTAMVVPMSSVSGWDRNATRVMRAAPEAYAEPTSARSRRGPRLADPPPLPRSQAECPAEGRCQTARARAGSSSRRRPARRDASGPGSVNAGACWRDDER